MKKQSDIIQEELLKSLSIEQMNLFSKFLITYHQEILKTIEMR